MSPTTAKKQPKQVQPTKPQVPQTEVSQNEDKQNRQYIIMMVVIMVVMVLVGGFFINKLFRSYLRKTNEIKAQDKYITALQQKKTDLAALDQNYQHIVAKQSNGLSIADVVYRALPITPEYKTLIGVMENIANESGVKVSVSPDSTSGSTAAATSAATGSTGNSSSDTVTTGGTPQPFIFSADVTGQYDQVIAFLSKTETSLRPINFKSMTVSGTSGTIDANITFETFYQGQADISDKTEPLK